MKSNLASNVLYVAEKKVLAAAIAEAYTDNPQLKNGYFDCGNNVLITWCSGHMFKLKTPQDYNEAMDNKWNLNDLPYNDLLKHQYTFSREKKDLFKKDQVKRIIELASKFNVIVHAGDPDDEGQRIVDAVLEHGGISDKNKTIFRIWVNDDNKQVILKEIARVKENREYLGLSQRSLARAVADQIYGFNLTVAYSAKNHTLLNVGRVSTPILGLIVNRESEHLNHIPSDYFNLLCDFSFDDKKLQAALINVPAEHLNSDKKIINEDYLKAIASKCNNCVPIVKSYKSDIDKQQPPLAYNLLKLQSDCSKMFGYKPQETLDITQALRDKYKAITYNRTDSQYLNDEHHEEAITILPLVALSLGLDIAFNAEQKTRVFNSSKTTAHHAIIPTAVFIKLDQLSIKEKNVYTLIAKRYFMQFVDFREVEKVSIDIEMNGETFRATSSFEISEGWKSIDPLSKKSAKEIILPKLEVGQSGTLIKTEIKKSKTEAPRLYTTDTLLDDLTRVAIYIKDPQLKAVLIERDKGKEDESGGIGTPATRGTIIETLYQNGFIQDNKKNIVPTDKGRRFFDILPEQLKSLDITALWEIEFQKIEKGELPYIQFIKDVNNKVADWVRFVIDDSEPYNLNPFLCKKCDAVLVKRKGRFGDFFSCSNHPDCDQTYKINPDGTPIYEAAPVEKSGYKCKSCGNDLILRESRYGKFFSCSSYPECKQNYKINPDGTPIYEVAPVEKSGYKCEKCNKALIKRKSGENSFYGCSGYPKCKETYKVGEDDKPVFKLDRKAALNLKAYD